jgi:hypothetical protein
MSFVPPRTATALAAVTAVLAAAPVAGASDPDATPAMHGCGYTGTSVFAPWNDDRLYTLTPDGGFENGADGWALEDGAAVVDGNETFQVGEAADHRSLALPASSSATSPSFCVTKRDHVFRLFARTDGGRSARLKVEVLYTDAQNGRDSVRVGTVLGGDAWDPTRPLPVVLPPRAHGKTDISLRFTPRGDGNWQIDDVYLDPRLRG